MLRNIFGSKNLSNRSGFYKVDNGKLYEIEQKPGNGSINSCIEFFGYDKNLVHTILTFQSEKIECLGFKIFSQEPIFVLAKNPKVKVSESDLRKELNQIDWPPEYSSLNVESILEDAILFENLDIKFLQSVVDLKDEGNELYVSRKLGAYLQFENGIFKSFTSSELGNSSTKWLQGINPSMVRDMIGEARKFQQNEIDVMEEVNKLADSILAIPQAANNEYIPLHYTKYGNVNWFNLYIAHYKKDCQIEDFLFMNKGRYRNINSKTIEVGKYIYSFAPDGKLEGIVYK